MKKYLRNIFIAFCCLSFLGTIRLAAQDPSSSFGTEKSSWHEGFDRYDFIMDEETLAITPIKAPEGEKSGVREPAKGQRRCIVIVPKKAAPGNPWSWRGCYWDYQPQTEIELLKRGFCIAYTSASASLKPGKEWDAGAAIQTAKRQSSHDPAGGNVHYPLAPKDPGSVATFIINWSSK